MFYTMSDGSQVAISKDARVLTANRPDVRKYRNDRKVEGQTIKAKRDSVKPGHRLPRLQTSEANRRIKTWQKSGRVQGDGYAPRYK